jgi:23S rRNA (cytosine1962-C5)-methyltransferase
MEMEQMVADGEVQSGSDGSGVKSVTVTRRGAERLRGGHLWVYRSDLQGSATPKDIGEPERGALVTVVDGRGLALGTALYSAGSQIALRMVSGTAGVGRAEYLDDLRGRVSAAIALRDELAPVSAENDARRLIFSEADDLPGIVADQYGDLVVVQLLVQGTARADVRGVLGGALAGALGGRPGTVWERTDSRIREIEGLEAGAEEAMWAGGEPRSQTIFHLNGLGFQYDVGAGQKTGAFLDQRLNYAAAARHARGRALDVCTYQGGFALHLARMCERVTGVDASRAALEVADRNLEMNGGALRAAVDWIEADAFELMRAYQDAGERFETIVLDPPAFAKTKRATEGALRGYKELNLRALRMLSAGGTLVTCSCSHHVPLEEFTGVVAAAAADAGRRVQVLETRGAAPDHPALLTMPETRYLKCLICRVV